MSKMVSFYKNGEINKDGTRKVFTEVFTENGWYNFCQSNNGKIIPRRIPQWEGGN